MQTGSGLGLPWSLVLSVVVGIVTYVLIALLKHGFWNEVVPWYRSLKYGGFDVGGDWVVDTKGTVQTAEIYLEQTAEELSGSCTFLADKEGPWEPKRVFDVSGEIYGSFVHLRFRHRDRQRLGIGAFVLEVVGDGRNMAGYQTNYGLVWGGIGSFPCTFRRPDQRYGYHPQLDLFRSRWRRSESPNTSHDGSFPELDGDAE